MTDLTDRLARAAVAAIEDIRADLERDPASIRGLTVELTLGPDGGLADAISYVERRKKADRLALLDHPSVRTA